MIGAVVALGGIIIGYSVDWSALSEAWRNRHEQPIEPVSIAAWLEAMQSQKGDQTGGN